MKKNIFVIIIFIIAIIFLTVFFLFSNNKLTKIKDDKKNNYDEQFINDCIFCCNCPNWCLCSDECRDSLKKINKFNNGCPDEFNPLE